MSDSNQEEQQEESFSSFITNSINVFSKLSWQEIISQYKGKALGLIAVVFFVAMYSPFQMSITLAMLILSYPATYFFLKYNKLAQAIATFSITICQPGLMEIESDNEEEESDNDNPKLSKDSDISPLDKMKMDEEKYQDLEDKKDGKEDTKVTETSKVSVSEPSSRKNSTASESCDELADFTVISESDVNLIPKQ